MNRIKKTFLFFCLLTSLIGTKVAAQSSWVRYNVAGYDPVRPKQAVVMSTTNLAGTSWSIKDSLNTTVASGALSNSITAKGDYMPMAFNHVIDFGALHKLGSYKLDVGTLPTVIIKIKPQPYKELLSQILRTIRVRRSGSADALDHAISHLGDSSCTVYKRTVQEHSNLDKTNSGTDSWRATNPIQKYDLQGGYYDAGDYIKFTLTTARLTYLLLRSYETAPQLFDDVKKYSTTSWDDLLDETQWGLDYLMKCMPKADEFIIQTGGHKDHEQSLRLPENDLLNGKRECYSALSQTQMGLAAATLALGSKVFGGKGEHTLATAYKAKAIQIYAVAKASKAPIAWWQTSATGGESYYADRSAHDNMELAAIELYHLTKEATYLNDAITYGQAAGAAYWSAWNSYNLPAHIRLYPEHKGHLPLIKQDLDAFRANANRSNNIWKIPHESVWGSLYSQISVACSALEYTHATKDSSYMNMGYHVADYMMGRNPWGLAFVASKDIPNAITSSYAVIYRLQPNKFPYGEVAEGPATASDYAGNSQYFSPAHNPNLWHSQFNTSKFTFFEQPGDYISMETTIGGLGDSFYFLTLASHFFFDNNEVVAINDEIAQERGGITLYTSRREGHCMLEIRGQGSEPFDLQLMNVNGMRIAQYEQIIGKNVVLPAQLPAGIYIACFSSNVGKNSVKLWVKDTD